MSVEAVDERRENVPALVEIDHLRVAHDLATGCGAGGRRWPGRRA
jgi:hypothetical protein